MSKQDPFWERENKKQIDRLLERAKSGDVFAVYSFAEYLYEGILVDKNIYEAAKWYKLAADEGHAGAMAKLNEMYAKGEISEMYVPRYMPPTPKSYTPSFFGGKKKSSSKQSKKVYDGNFGDVDPNLAALYNDEHAGYEEKTMTFKESYGRKKNINRYNYDDDNNFNDYDDNSGDDGGDD